MIHRKDTGRLNVGTVTIVGGEWPAFEGRFAPNENFAPFKELFDRSNADDDDTARKAQDEIDDTLSMTLLDHEDLAREDVDLFLEGEKAFWRPNSDRYIWFYRQDEPLYGCFSNFHKGFPVTIDGVVWPTTEHYYQAMKFPDNHQVQEQIRQVKWAGHAWKVGNACPESFDHHWWNGVRDGVMLKALRAKFEQHATFRPAPIYT